MKDAKLKNGDYITYIQDILEEQKRNLFSTISHTNTSTNKNATNTLQKSTNKKIKNSFFSKKDKNKTVLETSNNDKRVISPSEIKNNKNIGKVIFSIIAVFLFLALFAYSGSDFWNQVIPLAIAIIIMIAFSKVKGKR